MAAIGPSRAGSGLLGLQRAAGNRAVARIVQAASTVIEAPPSRAAAALISRPIVRDGPERSALAQAGMAGSPEFFAQSAGSVTAGPVPVHDSGRSHLAAAALGVHAYTFRGGIGLGAGLDESSGPGREAVLAHELAHVRQTAQPGTATEADAEAAAQQGRHDVSADPGTPLGLAWLIPLAVGAYILLRPNVANAPSPEDVRQGNLRPSVSPVQVAGEAIALFAVPGGVTTGLARAGYSVIAATAVGGAASSVAFRGVQDAGAGEFSGPQAYIVDAGTGALIGVVIGGAVRIRGGPQALGAPGPQPKLVHFTTAERQSAILARSESGQAIGALRGRTGIWALTDDALTQQPWQRAARATMSVRTAQAPVSIPPEAAGQFSRALPMGPVSGWQYAMGVYRAPAGSISMATGQFGAAGGITGNLRGLFFPYGADGAIWISAASVGWSAGQSETADQRGIRTLLPSLPVSIRPTVEANLTTVTETTRTDGPFVVLPGLSAQAALAGAEGSYDPVAEVCYGPERNASEQSDADETPAPVTIYVAPFWPGYRGP